MTEKEIRQKALEVNLQPDEARLCGSHHAVYLSNAGNVCIARTSFIIHEGTHVWLRLGRNGVERKLNTVGWWPKQ